MTFPERRALVNSLVGDGFRHMYGSSMLQTRRALADREKIPLWHGRGSYITVNAQQAAYTGMPLFHPDFPVPGRPCVPYPLPQ